jgi:hypothetical protein
MKRDEVTESPAGRWTRSEDYLGALARKRKFRQHRRAGDRTQPEAPRLFLSTIPFLALIALLAILAAGIMVAAFPGSQPELKSPQPPHKELGVAPKGWFQKAQREFHR